jgi:DNA-binding CsgD family transcriptional regulator
VPSDGLSGRELEVLRLVAGGESNALIARRLGLSTHTVERHVVNLYRKIGARGRADATAYALCNGLPSRGGAPDGHEGRPAKSRAASCWALTWA